MRNLIIAPLHNFYSNPRNPLPNTISLEGGYKIRPFNTRTLDYVFSFFGATYSEWDRDELQRCRYAIYYSYEPEDGATADTPTNMVQDINRIVQALRIVKRTRVVPTIFHLRIRGRARDALQIYPKPPREITYIDHDTDMEHFVREDAAKIRKYWRDVRNLFDTYGGVYNKVLNAVIFFELAHFESIFKTRLIHLVTCLESLFNTSDDQISYSLRIRCSYFLERNSESRVLLASEIKDIYGLRSKFVHGQSAPRAFMRPDSEPRQRQLMMLAEDIARKCIQKIFNKTLVPTFSDIDILNSEFALLEEGGNSILR